MTFDRIVVFIFMFIILSHIFAKAGDHRIHISAHLFVNQSVCLSEVICYYIDVCLEDKLTLLILRSVCQRSGSLLLSRTKGNQRYRDNQNSKAKQQGQSKENR